jgi:hypothetical protein
MKWLNIKKISREREEQKRELEGVAGNTSGPVKHASE